jgi:23S rRNA (cytosine1962-C5)-methyltransferase
VADVILKPRRAQPFFGGHPWLFSGAVARVEGTPEPGDEVTVRSHEGEFVARGLFNPHSQIQVRLYRWDDLPLDAEFWQTRVTRAVSLRRDLLGLCGPNQACRLLFSEADGISGLVVDRFDDWLLVQFNSAALAVHQTVLLNALRQAVQPRGIWLRTEKGIRDAEGWEPTDGLAWGEPPPRPIILTENGLEYAVDVVEGQKTGFYCDQRDNRLAAAKYFAGRSVLDVCCYSGGFTLNALRSGGAARVTAVDVSATALELARQNVERNGFAGRVEFEKSDAFKSLERRVAAGERWGAVVLDPPKLTRHGRGVPEALRGYHSLNRMAVDILEPGGILVTCSCTGHVARAAFHEMLAEVARSTGRNLQILEDRGAAADHPTDVRCPETEYLKCCICRVG